VNTTSISTLIWVVIAPLVVIGAFLVWTVVYKRHQTLRLKRRFGGEYDRTVHQLGDQSQAENELKIRSLTMTARGYPMGDFERRAADISVDHPAVVTAYRGAQRIAVKDAREGADTEELRTAIVHYRTLFSELLESDRGLPVSEQRAKQGMKVQS
jgi:hypothetical protein